MKEDGRKHEGNLSVNTESLSIHSPAQECSPLVSPYRVSLRLGSFRSNTKASESLEHLGVDTRNFCGFNLVNPSGQDAGQSASNCANWLYAASLVHKAKYERIKDSKGRGVDEWKDCRRDSCYWMFCYSMAGIGTAMWSDYTLYLENEELSGRSISLQFCTAVFSAAALYYLVCYYHAELCILRVRGVRVPPGFGRGSLRSANLWTAFVVDAVILMGPLFTGDPQVQPQFIGTIMSSKLGLDGWDDVLLGIMLLRLKFIPRFVAHCLQNVRTHEADVFFKLNNSRQDDGLLMRCAMSASSAPAALCLASALLCFTYLIMAFERAAVIAPLKLWANAMWLVVNTMTTVGYGDLYPTTGLGRIAAAVLSVIAILLIPMTVSMVNRSLELARAESRVLSLLSLAEARRSRTHAAARLVTAALRYTAEMNRAARAVAAHHAAEAEAAVVLARERARGSKFLRLPPKQPVEPPPRRPAAVQVAEEGLVWAATQFRAARLAADRWAREHVTEDPAVLLQELCARARDCRDRLARAEANLDKAATRLRLLLYAAAGGPGAGSRASVLAALASPGRAPSLRGLPAAGHAAALSSPN